MKKQFESKEEFEKWINDNFQQTVEEMLSHQITDEEIIQKLLEQGYTDLNDLVADGHGYQIGEYTNNGWIYEDEADMNYINATGRKTEIRKRGFMLKRYFAKDFVGEAVVLFVDEFKKAVFVNDTAFDKTLTFEVAKRADYSNFDGGVTAEEAAANYFTGENLIDFNENDWEVLVEF